MDADPITPWTPPLLTVCAERCSEVGDPACWRVVDDATPCEECKLIVDLRASGAMP